MIASETRIVQGAHDAYLPPSWLLPEPEHPREQAAAQADCRTDEKLKRQDAGEARSDEADADGDCRDNPDQRAEHPAREVGTRNHEGGSTEHCEAEHYEDRQAAAPRRPGCERGMKAMVSDRTPWAPRISTPSIAPVADGPV